MNDDDDDALELWEPTGFRDAQIAPTFGIHRHLDTVANLTVADREAFEKEKERGCGGLCIRHPWSGYPEAA